MSRSGVDYGPWHVLTVEAIWYCEPGIGDLCRDPEGFCGGHDKDGDGREFEGSLKIEHPAECPIPPCCCTETDADWLAEHIDPECQNGRHNECLNRDRCYTERDVFEWSDMYDELKVSGVYRVRVWGSGPDHNGEYDAGIDCEPVEAVSAS